MAADAYYPPSEAVDAFRTWMRDTEVTDEVAKLLLSVLTRIRVVMLVDDSGSMEARVNEPIPGQTLQPDPWRQGTFFPLRTRPTTQTRWGEAQQAAASLCQLLTSVSPVLLHPNHRANNRTIADPPAGKTFLAESQGLDVWFLNRNGVSSVTQRSDLATQFSTPPSGRTPLVTSVRNIIQAYTPLCQQGCHVLLLIVGDGEPSDGGVYELQQAFTQKPNNFHISFVECNDNEEEMAWMDSLDGRVYNFHNLDDFRLETLRIAYFMGATFRYTYNDYIISAILSTFIPKYFLLDQARSAGITMLSLEELPTDPPPFEWLSNPALPRSESPPEPPAKKYSLTPAGGVPYQAPARKPPLSPTTSTSVPPTSVPSTSPPPLQYHRSGKGGCCQIQ